VFSIYDPLGDMTVLLITIEWLQKIGKNWQCVNKEHRIWKGQDEITGN